MPPDDINDEQRGISARQRGVPTKRPMFNAVDRGLAPNPQLVKRCREYRMRRVPATYERFEDEIVRWIATCVTSRSFATHREIALVRGNATLINLWNGLAPRQENVRIIPHYTWGPNRVEAIAFSSPDIAAAPAPGSQPPARSVPPSGPPAGPRGHEPGAPGSAHPVPRPKPDKPDRKPRRRRGPPGAPGFPNDFEDILDDARELLKWLRARDEYQDARRLEELVRQGKSWAVALVLLVGAYYIGVKYRGGKLLFQWGWTAAGYKFRRALSRLPYLVAGAEEIAQEIVVIASRHPEFAGTGIPWKVLDQEVDRNIPAQIDDFACGPACVEIVLRDRGISISHETIVTRARKHIHEEIKKQTIAMDALLSILRELDPRGDWQGGNLTRPSNLRDLVNALNKRGSWIAYIGDHNIVVEGLDASGKFLIRDPWYEPGLQRGIRAGSRYTIPWDEFVQRWGRAAIFPDAGNDDSAH
jgi:hypothetical protein